MDLTEGIVKQLSKRVSERLREYREHEFDADVEELRNLETVCAHAEWRWLDCEPCRETIGECGEKVCVACGAEV